MEPRSVTGKVRLKQGGFTYLAALFLIGIMGAIWAAIGGMWSTANQREKERELLLIGAQFRQAIGQYYERSPGVVKRFPNSLDDLLQDDRELGTQRHLRKIFVDPMMRSNKWGLVISPMGGIMGVHSLSEATPIKNSNFQDADLGLAGKTKYSEWLFVYRPTPVVAPMK